MKTAWIWLLRTGPTITSTRAGVSTAGRRSQPRAAYSGAGPSVGHVRIVGSRNGNGSPVLNHPGDFPFGLDGYVDYGIIWAAFLTLVVRVEVVGLNLAVPRIPTE